MSAPYGLHGMYLCTFWSSIAPYCLVVLCHLCHTILMGDEDMAIVHQHSIADFSTPLFVFVSPLHLSVFDYKHSHALTLPGIKEIVTVQLAGDILCRGCHRTQKQQK